jgi:hypothetical protein
LRRSVRTRETQASEKITLKVSTPQKAILNAKKQQSDSKNVGNNLVCSPKRSPRKNHLKAVPVIHLLLLSFRKLS